jgi:ribonuclease P protein component
MSENENIEGKAAGSVPFFRLETIKTRPDFKAANGGPRYATPGFTMLRSAQPGGAGIRLGFTVTKKLGKAVLRNRIRRRLKAAAQAALKVAGPQLAPVAIDFVVLARAAAAQLPFPTLHADLARAMISLSQKAVNAEKPSSERHQAKAKLGKTPPLA